jgi:uncharacterized protein
MAPRPWSLTDRGVALVVRLTPKGGRDSVDGIDVLADGRAVFKARVRGVPRDGEANAALIRMIAKAVGVPPRDIVLAAGDIARVKRLVIPGDGPTLIAALEKIAVAR